MTLPTNDTSKKFYLIEIRFNRDITGDCSSLGSPNYTATATLDYNTALELYVDGAKLTRASSTSLSTGEWHLDQTTKLLTFRIAASSFTTATVVYPINVTNDVDRIYPTYPDGTVYSYSLHQRWQGRLTSTPIFSFDSTNIFTGQLSIGNYTLNINNADGWFQQFLTNEDNFYLNDVAVYHAIIVNGAETIEKVTGGRINSVSANNTMVSLNVDGPLGTLKKKYLSNVTYEGSHFNTDNFADLSPGAVNRPIPKLYCFRTWETNVASQPLPTYQSYNNTSGGGGSVTTYMGFGIGPESTNIDYDFSASVTTNRIRACYVSNASSGQHSENITSSVNDYGTTYRVGVVDVNKYRPQDEVTINGQRAFVEGVYSSSEVSIFSPNQVPSVGHTLLRPEISLVAMHDPSPSGGTLATDLPWVQHLQYTIDYTLSTSGGVTTIVLTDDFESYYRGGTMSSAAIIYYRAHGPSDIDHTTIAQDLLEQSGLDVNSDSITASASTLSADLDFMVPGRGEEEFPPLLTIMAKVCASTLSVIGITGSEITYTTLSSPENGEAVTAGEILDGTFRQTINYTDITPKIRFYNLNGTDAIDVVSTPGTYTDYTGEEILTNNSGAYNIIDYDGSADYTLKNFVERESILQLPASRNSYILQLLARRASQYSFSTAGINFNTKVGDNIRIDRDDLIGGYSSREVVVTAVSKSIDRTDITCTDLLAF